MSNYRIRCVRSGDPVSSDFLMHFGIRGMKWGVRRFQNDDGTYTAAGRDRYGIGDGKSYSKVSDHGESRNESSSKGLKKKLDNFDRLSKEDRKIVSEEIVTKMDKLVKDGRNDEAEKYGRVLSESIERSLPKNVFDIGATDPISQENQRTWDLDSQIKNRRNEIEKEIGYKQTVYSSADSKETTQQKKQQEKKEWDRLMKAISKDSKIQSLCREQKGSSEALIKKIINQAGLSDSPTVESWVSTLVLGGQNYAYMTYMRSK